MKPIKDLHRYWIMFNPTSEAVYSPAIGLGCGVTAIDVNDALALIHRKVFNGGEMPQLLSVIEDVNIPDLDQNHVIPNMLPPHERGIWFPLGYD